MARSRVYVSVQPGFRSDLVDRGRPVRVAGAVEEPFCAPVEYAGRGAPQLLIVSDLPLQMPRSSLQPLQFTDAIRGFPEVLECYVLMGAVDFLLRIVTSDIEAYERFFFEKLSMVPGIQEVNSIVALSEIKSTTSLPVLR